VILTIGKKTIQQEDFRIYHWIIVSLSMFILAIVLLLTYALLPIAFVVGYIWRLLTGHYPYWIRINA
jgi:hypothetical protein